MFSIDDVEVDGDEEDEGVVAVVERFLLFRVLLTFSPDWELFCKFDFCLECHELAIGCSNIFKTNCDSIIFYFLFFFVSFHCVVEVKAAIIKKKSKAFVLLV